LRVLIIDDEEDIRQIARFALSKVSNWDVTEASSAEEGLKQANEMAPDAILLDVLMPGMDGPTALVSLKSDEATKGIPVIFLTARGLPGEIDRLIKMGAAGVITKPFDPMTLGEEMSEILRRL